MTRPVVLVVVGFAAAAAVARVAAVAAAPAGASVPSDAVVWHGAMEAYGRLAQWAGRHALACEVAYWEAVK